MEKKYHRSRIGEVHTTNEGYELTIIDGGSKRNFCTFQINDYISETQYSNTVNGEVKYPYHPSVFEVGYFGVGNYSKTTYKKIRQTWQGMLERSYDSKCQEKHPTYRGTEVCKEWLNFQVFAKWMDEESNYQESWHLDKDLLSTDNKIYSPTTCIFIPRRLNSFLANLHSTNTSGYTGVRWYKSNSKWVARISVEGKLKHLGYFDTAEKASQAYNNARTEEVEKLQKLYKEVLPPEAISAIR